MVFYDSGLIWIDSCEKCPLLQSNKNCRFYTNLICFVWGGQRPGPTIKPASSRSDLPDQPPRTTDRPDHPLIGIRSRNEKENSSLAALWFCFALSLCCISVSRLAALRLGFTVLLRCGSTSQSCCVASLLHNLLPCDSAPQSCCAVIVGFLWYMSNDTQQHALQGEG